MPAVSLTANKAAKFLNLLAEEPFVCVVVVEGGLHLFSKDMDEEQLQRIRDSLVTIEKD